MNNKMSPNQDIPRYDASHYAVVDLGSNSFHLLITQLVIKPHSKALINVKKVKQKIRLAAGLDNNNYLSDEAITRAIDCLKNFSLYLRSIPKENILIVGTAALRIAKNNVKIFDAANKFLPKNIKLLTGEQEAETIYAGVHHAAKNNNVYTGTPLSTTKQLVIDIGGASTEIIVGLGSTPQKVVSLNIGCVSFIEKYFTNGLLTEQNFDQCVIGASNVISTVKDEFIQLGWQTAVSRSGSMQALVEILSEKNEKPIITLDFLNKIKTSLIQCQSIEQIDISGLRADRKPVLASGLSILIALFEGLNINSLHLSQGALREGLLFQLLPDATIS